MRNKCVLTALLAIAGGAHADLDGDGSVGASDLLMVLAQWGPCD